jgi:hypothetical protein
VGERTNLHAILVGALGSSNVYFQPPESIRIDYPCIVYQRDRIDAEYANNEKYSHLTRYQVTAIDKDPDAVWKLNILNLPLCRHNRFFTSDGLNHDVFELYY